ncbi:MAG: CtpF protein [Phyllobacteriaceae bacterium]|jgi:pilus assembly protein CpaE|nr:CtpF protein [Phyllobacteriaceae bacterium]
MNSAAHIQPQTTAPQDDLVALVPRVDIHIFCETQETGQAIQVASGDRRMARAHVTIQLGGIAAAVQVYQSQPTPNVLVVETHGNRDQVMAELSRLAEVCQATTKVVVIGHVNDVILYRELIRAGISEYVVAPMTSFGFIEIVAGLFNDPKAAPLGRIVAFVGAKGGVGSSTIAHNIGWALSQRQNIDTIITDLDLAFGTAALNFNQDGSGGIMDALGQPDRVDSTLIERLMTKLGNKLSLLNGPGSVDRDMVVEAHAIETILNVVRYSAPMVVVDVPNMWAPWIKYTLLNADEIIITATPELPALRNAKNLVDLLKAQRPNDKPPRLIINQVGVPKRPEIPVNDFAKAIGLTPSAVIPHDPQSFGMAQGNGQMIFEVAPKSKSAEVLADLARTLAGNQKIAPEQKKSGSLLAKLPLFKKK